uniref:Uncharacterized protein n=1 Tax=Glossina palpalis gambiensis TaxID=67801 RepID=A0A1B0B8N4_9MUSC
MHSLKTVKTDGIENQLCSCDSLDDSSSRSSNNSVNSPDANISRIRIRPVASAILNCILARQLCFEDPSCSAILEIIPRVCGPIPERQLSNKYQSSTRPCFSLESAIRYINTIKKLFPRNLSVKEHILRLEASKEIVIPFWKRHQKLLDPLPLVVVVMSNFLIVRFCQEHLNVTQQESQYDKELMQAYLCDKGNVHTSLKTFHDNSPSDVYMNDVCSLSSLCLLVYNENMAFCILKCDVVTLAQHVAHKSLHWSSNVTVLQ